MDYSEAPWLIESYCRVQIFSLEERLQVQKVWVVRLRIMVNCAVLDEECVGAVTSIKSCCEYFLALVRPCKANGALVLLGDLAKLLKRIIINL